MSRRRRSRNFIAAVFHVACLGATLTCILLLFAMLGMLFYEGWKWLDWTFITHFPSRHPDKAGIKSALAGSVWLISLTSLISVVIGVASAIYMEEYMAPSRWKRVVQTNIANLAGVPSIVYGILGLGLFVRYLHLGNSILAGALTLSLVILPIIIMAAQEALRAVPPSIRHASYALGATRWQTVSRQVLPAAMPGIMTGVILAISRALGEAAPLVIVGALGYVAFTPSGLTDQFTALPLQIFNWASRPQADFHGLAAAGILVLLTVLICMNALAVAIRYRFSKQVKW